MTDSYRRPQQPAPTPPQRQRVEALATQLTADLNIGNLDRSRSLLRMTPPDTARAALVTLGPGYVDRLKESGHLTFGKLRGKDAADAFIKEELRPIARGAARKPQTQGTFRRLARSVAKVALIAGLALPLFGPEHNPTQGELSSVTTPVNAVVTTEDIRPLFAEFAKVSLGREMLEMAERSGVTISYDASLTGTGTAGSYNFNNKTVRMDPARDMTEQVMYLAHELRHAWQDAALNFGEMERRMLTPSQQWTLRRFLEADAFSFSAYFMAVRMKELPNEALPADNNREIPAARLLHDEFSSDDGLTASEYRQHSLDRMFTTLGAYNQNHSRLAMMSNDELHNHISDVMKSISLDNLAEGQPSANRLRERMETTPSQEAFEEYLRRFGGLSLSPTQPTALQDRVAAPAPDAAAGAPNGKNESAATVLTPLPSVDDTNVKAQVAAAEAIHQNYRSLAQEIMRVHETRMEQQARREAAQKKAAEQAQPPQSRFVAPQGETAPQQPAAPNNGAPPQPSKKSILRL